MWRPARSILLGLLFVFLGAATWAQPGASPAGHWEGSIQALNQAVDLSADLARNPAGIWIGSLSVPMANAIDLPLTDISVQDNAVRFAIADFPGKPAFEGKLSADGNELAGNATNPNGVVPFKLLRKGEANVKLPTPSTAMSADFEGTWNGTIDASQAVLRVVVKLSRAGDGSATGIMISVDQGGQEVPMSTVTIQGKQLQFEMRAVGGMFRGTLGANGEITGTFAQGAARLPMALKRVSAGAK
jgi:hypothetical protein